MGKCCVCYCESIRSVLGVGRRLVFVKYCEPVSVGGGKALCLLSTVNLSVLGVGRYCVC